MSGRFGHLEFEEPRRQRPRQEPLGVPEATPEGYLRMAVEEYRWGRCEKALQMFTRTLAERRTVIPAWVGQVQMLVQLGEFNEARLWADKALELFRGNGELLAAKAQACARLRDNRAAYACSDASMQAADSSAWRWQVRGEVLLANAQNTHEPCFKKSLAEPDADWFDRLVIAGMYLFYDRPVNAQEYAAAATELKPGFGYTWFVLGHCQRRLGMANQAARSYHRCLELRPDYKEAMAAIAELACEPWYRRLLRRLGWRTA